MFEFVDLSAASPAPTADVHARVEAIYAVRRPPTSATLVFRPHVELAAAGFTRVQNSHVIAFADQRWWTCPCTEDCPHAVLYGRVEGRNLIALVPASYFDVPADRPLAPVVIVVDSLDNIDEVIRGLDQVGQPGLATMLLVWLELGLRDALTGALAERANA